MQGNDINIKDQGDYYSQIFSNIYEFLQEDENADTNLNNAHHIDATSIKMSVDLKILNEQLGEAKTSFTQALEKINSDFKEKISYLKENFTDSSTFFIQKITYQFSSTLKSPAITITDKINAKNTSPSDNQQKFILLEPKLSLSKKGQWGIKISQIANWIAVGICLKDNIITKQGYKFNYSNLGHGSYMLSSNGYSWSHSESGQNNHYANAFTFTTNDIIYMQFDPVRKKLVMIKNGVNQIFEMDIKTDEKDDYMPCAILWSNNDSVQVINDVKPQIFKIL